MQIVRQQQQRWDDVHGLWRGALEVFVHQLLYVRRVYPKQSFCKSRFLGAQFHACRHPGVVSYISQAVAVAVPAILSGESGGGRYVEEIWIEVYDRATLASHERYVLSFSSKCSDTTASSWVQQLLMLSSSAGRTRTASSEDSVTDDVDNVDAIFELFERELRDLICSVGILHGVGRPPWSDSTSFKILLSTKSGKTTSGTNDTTIGSSSVDGAISSAEWFRASSTSDGGDQAKSRIVYSIPNFGCQFHYMLTHG